MENKSDVYALLESLYGPEQNKKTNSAAKGNQIFIWSNFESNLRLEAGRELFYFSECFGKHENFKVKVCCWITHSVEMVRICEKDFVGRHIVQVGQSRIRIIQIAADFQRPQSKPEKSVRGDYQKLG